MWVSFLKISLVIRPPVFRLLFRVEVGIFRLLVVALDGHQKPPLRFIAFSSFPVFCSAL
jgi:hypothetical protein